MGVRISVGLGALLIASLAFAVPVQASLGVYSFFPATGGSGETGGRFSTTPAGVAVNDTTGDVYVVDSGNNRVEQFDAEGGFIRAWGNDVVAASVLPGERENNEMQAVMVNATAGQFKLVFGGAETADISATATALQVQAALNGLATVSAGGGSVSVSGGPGDAGGNTPYIVNFNGGPLKGTNVASMTVAAGTTPLSGGSGVNANEAKVNVFSEGAGTGFEVCEAAASCKKGLTTATGGGMSVPRGIAINQLSGHVYVTSQTLRRVDEFDARGNFVRSWGKDTIASGPHANSTNFEICTGADVCQTGATGTTAGAFSGATVGSNFFYGYPAVVPPGPSNAGNVLVTDPNNRRVQEFTATGAFVRAFGTNVVASGPSDAGTAFEVCLPTDVCQAGTGSSAPGDFITRGPNSIAVDTTGAIYTVEAANAAGNSNTRVQKFTPQVGFPGLSPSVFAEPILSGVGIPGPGGVTEKELSSPAAVAVDPVDNHVYVLKAFRTGEGIPAAEAPESRVLELSPAGALLDSHMQGAGISPGASAIPIAGVAVKAGGARAYVSSTTIAPRVYVLAEVPPPTATVGAATDVTSEEATLHATVSPAVTPAGLKTSYRFEYSKNGFEWLRAPAASVDIGNGTAGGTSAVCPTPPAASCEVSQQVTGLDANQEYQVRVVATTEFNGARAVVSGPPFTTSAGPPVPATGVALWSSPPETAPTLLLEGEVNPKHDPTSFYFQYVDEDTYLADLGSGDGFQHSLQTATADAGHGLSSIAVRQVVFDLDPAKTYRYRLVATNSVGTREGTVKSVAPPEVGGRFFERVSDGDSWGSGIGGQIGSIADDGERAGFTAQAFGQPQSVPGPETPYIAERGEDGWSVQPMVPAPELAGGSPFGSRYMFDDRLGAALWPESTRGQRQRGEVQWGVHRIDGSEEAVSPLLVPLDHADLTQPNVEYALRGAAGDLSSLTFIYNANESTAAGVKLQADEPLLTNLKSNLYEIANGGELRIVNRQSNPSPGTPGAIIGGGCGAGLGGTIGNGGGIASNAVSIDGSSIYFTAVPTAPNGSCGSIPTGQRLYKRTNGTTTLEVSAPQCTPTPACPGSPAGDDNYQGASTDGDVAFFTTPRRLLNSDTGTTADLYVYDATPPSGQPNLVQASLGEPPAAEAKVLGVLDNSADGSRVYFVAEGVLSGANLQGKAPVANQPNLYVYERDGAHPTGRIGFVGKLSTFSKNNEEGQPIGDAFEWGSGGIGLDGQKASFALPSQGAAPDGHFLLFLSFAQLTAADTDSARDLYRFDDSATEGAQQLVCLSCSGNGNFDVEITPRNAVNSRSDYAQQARPASADLATAVFATREPLLSADENTVHDAYAWHNGALSLLTGATGQLGIERRSAKKTGISPDGRSAFFITAAPLVADDGNNSRDLYVARIDGGFPAEPGGPVCTTDAECRPGSQPAPVASSAASATFTGPGNQAPPKPCAKGQVRRKGKCVKKGAKSRHHRKRRASRAGHNRGGKR